MKLKIFIDGKEEKKYDFSKYKIVKTDGCMMVHFFTDGLVPTFRFGISDKEKEQRIEKYIKENMNSEIDISVDTQRLYLRINNNWQEQYNGNYIELESVVF